MPQHLPPAPSSTVLGATDPAAMAAFLAVFGGQPRRVPPLSVVTSSSLYGIEAELDQVVVTEPRSGATIRIVGTPHPAPTFTPLVAGPYGIDYYTRDLELSQGMLRAVGGREFSPLVGYTGVPNAAGPQITGHITHELMLRGPDELAVFLTDVTATSRPWPTLLDVDPDRVHSELLQMCWVVDDMDAERAFWLEEVGWICVLDEVPDLDEMQTLMSTPGNSPLRCVHVTGAAGNHKIELMAYPAERVGARAHWPLRGGLHCVTFDVADLDATMAALPSAHFGIPLVADAGRGPQRVVTATSPGGCVRFELWEVLRPGGGGTPAGGSDHE
ncbi:MAG: hypothetical protein JST91_18805 [Actinobacteria bacterium]|nr:hypothetical protein [Actinomycetota bacterium]